MTKKPLPFWLLEAPIILFLSLVILPLLAKGLGTSWGLSNNSVITISFTLQQLSLILGTIYLKNKYPLYPEEPVELKPNWRQFWRSLFWLPAIILINILAAGLATKLLTPILGVEKIQSLLVKETSRADILLLDSWGLIISILFICVIGPLSEELFFRGFFFSRMSAYYSPQAAYIVTSLFFAFPHFYLVNFLPIVLLSFVLCYIARHDGLWGAIGAHVFYNTVVLFNLIFLIV